MLTAIYIKGFKTFANPVRMPLEGGVTAIVGPNGSGKSNVTDAVLFALGEQRPGLLRAGGMSDLIFSGSDSLSGARVAEVTLALDNSAGTISLPYREVSLTRRITREGDSEYRINGSRSRLADVRSVAGELGIGHHSILRQGAVDSIVTGGAAACRNALEEAAGLGVYRRRRVTASRRLDRAEAGLEQSRQLEASLTEQLQRIEQEAVAAREYRELESRYRKVSLAHLYRVASNGLDEQRKELSAGEELVGELEGRERGLEELRVAAEERLGELDTRSRELESWIRSLEDASEGLQRGSLRAERARFGLQEARRAEAERARLSGRLRQEMERIEAALGGLEEEASAAQEELSARQAELEERRTELSRAREERADAESRSSRAKRDLGTLRSRRDKSAAGAVGEGSRKAPDEEELRGISEAVPTLEGRLRGENRAQLKEIGDRAGSLRGRAEELSSRVSKRRGELDAVTGRAEAVIRSLSPTGAGEREARDTTRLHEVLRARPGFENAVQAALGEIADGALARDVEEAISLLEGDETVAVRLDASPVNGSDGAGKPLTDCVEILDPERGEPLRRLLAGIYVVDHPRVDLPENGHVTVTREGLRLTRTSASHLPRAGDAEDGEFVRGARLEAEKQRLQALREGPEKSLEALRSEITAVSDRAAAAARDVSAADSLAERAERAVRAITSGASRRLERLQRERERLVARRQETERLDREISTAEESLREADRAGEAARQKLEAAASTEEEARSAAAEIQHRLSRTEEALREGRERRTRISTELGRAESGAGEELAVVAAVSNRLVEAGGATLEAARSRLAALRERRDELAEGRRKAAEERDEISGHRTGLASELATARAGVQRLRDELSRAEESVSAAEEEISSEWGADLETARREHEELDREADPGAERSRLSRKLNRFGDVNLLALSQEGELRERHEFVASQRADAEAAAGELADMIREIDDEIEARFTEMFSRVKQAFGDLVPRMMEGSAGELSLSEDGVEIGIRLGRRGHRPLNVLSGGERSLLALSFLFAIFLSRTGHESAGDSADAGAFCILDEAEAALDDLNLARFLSVVDSYRSTGQFLLVTHQKRTMAAADVLYGVTQEASGATAVVSKRLSGE
ncbi:AAA family ATPase [Rubrobacter aplysinae]|uniref:AAA family ATPase n=1 Tax=Rubrobacter aplysinae TaxID=909625 RepID=UPI00064C383C|nr:AAA family ATPase [Rubrobacter aplysinae]